MQITMNQAKTILRNIMVASTPYEGQPVGGQHLYTTAKSAMKHCNTFEGAIRADQLLHNKPQSEIKITVADDFTNKSPQAKVTSITSVLNVASHKTYVEIGKTPSHPIATLDC